MFRSLPAVLLFSLAAVSSFAADNQNSPRWTAVAANAWYAKQPWLVGSNYLPSNAINELEMWQAGTFSAKRIDEELSWAESIGMRTMRVFLHDLLWEDSSGFRNRILTFLSICDRHHIKPIFVLFDSCWDPQPKLGPQKAPRPGVHNSGWVQSPGAAALADPSQYPRLKAYVEGVVGAFRNDRRILAWDVWNEPDNTNSSSWGKLEPKNKVELIEKLLPQTFAWARAAHPSQPLTTGIWHEKVSDGKPSPFGKLQLDLSDVISFHNYDPPEQFSAEVEWLKSYGRPILCTEYMARPRGSTFEAILPVAKKSKVVMINWGFVAGKSQTFLPWDSWQKPYVDRQPAEWFHDVFKENGEPYRPAETAFIKQITTK